jgi:hypothetical protein
MILTTETPTIKLERSKNDVVVLIDNQEAGFILRPTCKGEGFEAWANQEPGIEHGQVYGFARAAVSTFAKLRDAVAFVQTEGVAL